jgi:C1A family cysteine protease
MEKGSAKCAASIGRKYNLKKSPVDPTDQKYTSHKLFQAGAPLPTEVDLRSKCPPVYDQGTLGSCTANAGCCAVEFDMIAQGEKDTLLSRLFLYYNERKRDGDVADDSGSTLRTCIKSIDSDGVCVETLCPYQIADFTHKPSAAAYTEAKKHKGVKSFALNQNLYELQHCLAVFGRPFVLGIQVYESFESQAVAETGIVPMPQPGEQLMGGHAVICVGYKPGYFIIRNSWGASWGDHGYFYLPTDFVLNSQYTSDLWCLEKVT